MKGYDDDFNAGVDNRKDYRDVCMTSLHCKPCKGSLVMTLTFNNGKDKPELALTSKGGIERSEKGERGGAQDESEADQTKLNKYYHYYLIIIVIII